MLRGCLRIVARKLLREPTGTAAQRTEGQTMDTITTAAQPERLAYASDLTDYEWNQIEQWVRQA